MKIKNPKEKPSQYKFAVIPKKLYDGAIVWWEWYRIFRWSNGKTTTHALPDFHPMNDDGGFEI